MRIKIVRRTMTVDLTKEDGEYTDFHDILMGLECTQGMAADYEEAAAKAFLKALSEAAEGKG